LDRIDDYRKVLESYSTRLLPTVHWEPTEREQCQGSQRHGRLLPLLRRDAPCGAPVPCVLKTIEENLPSEAAFVRCYDRFCASVEALVDMPGPISCSACSVRMAGAFPSAAGSASSPSSRKQRNGRSRRPTLMPSRRRRSLVARAPREGD